MCRPLLRVLGVSLALVLLAGCYNGVRVDGPEGKEIRDLVLETLYVDDPVTTAKNPFVGSPTIEIRGLDDTVGRAVQWRVLPFFDPCGVYLAGQHRDFPFPLIVRLEAECGDGQPRVRMVLLREGLTFQRIGAGPFQLFYQGLLVYTLESGEPEASGEKLSDREDINRGISYLRANWPNLPKEDLKRIAETARKWGVNREGLNQGITHYWKWQRLTAPGGGDLRLAAIAEKLSLNAGSYSPTSQGFAQFTDDMLRIASKPDLAAEITRLDGTVVQYTYHYSRSTGQGVMMVRRAGLFDSVMPKDLNNFRNFIERFGGVWR